MNTVIIVLMPPPNTTPPAQPPVSNPPTPPATPGGPFDFITKSAPPAPEKTGLKLPNLPKPVLILIGALGLLLIFIVIAVFLGSMGGVKTQAYVDIMSRSSEIVRVSDLTKSKMKDADALALLTTTTTALSSQQSQFSAYVSSTGGKVDPKLLGSYQNSETDKGLATAEQNSKLTEAYIIYLQGSLNGYLNSLNTAYSVASKRAKPIIAQSITSTKVLLSAPQFN